MRSGLVSCLFGPWGGECSGGVELCLMVEDRISCGDFCVSLGAPCGYIALGMSVVMWNMAGGYIWLVS